MKSLKATTLQPGSKVAVIAPASNIKPELLETGVAGLRSRGYEPIYLPGILERDLYFAGSIERRLRELDEMLERDDISAIICARGGYGTTYLLEHLDFEKFRLHPKIIMGYSDCTSLLTAIHDRSGLVTFHGPMVLKDFSAADGVEPSSWLNATGGAAGWNIPTKGMQVLNPGRAQARLHGGCLSLLVASLGTPFEIQTQGTILFLEDIGAKPYQIDRMLTQLRLAGKLEQVRGFVFGEMMDCVQPGGQDYTLQEVIFRVLKNYGVPIVYGLPSGHVSRGNITLPLGVQAELTAAGSEVSLRVVEAATEIGASGRRVIGSSETA